MELYCEQCIHEKFLHTAQEPDLKCDILSRTMLYDTKDEEYPGEWTYNEQGEPICTSFKKHKWYDDDGNLLEPPEVFPDLPRVPGSPPE